MNVRALPRYLALITVMLVPTIKKVAKSMRERLIISDKELIIYRKVKFVYQTLYWRSLAMKAIHWIINTLSMLLSWYVLVNDLFSGYMMYVTLSPLVESTLNKAAEQCLLKGMDKEMLLQELELFNRLDRCKIKLTLESFCEVRGTLRDVGLHAPAAYWTNCLDHCFTLAHSVFLMYYLSSFPSLIAACLFFVACYYSVIPSVNYTKRLSELYSDSWKIYVSKRKILISMIDGEEIGTENYGSLVGSMLDDYDTLSNRDQILDLTFDILSQISCYLIYAVATLISMSSVNFKLILVVKFFDMKGDSKKMTEVDKTLALLREHGVNPSPKEEEECVCKG